jgi:5-formyltetrahydrofolate cyclo-ligase
VTGETPAELQRRKQQIRAEVRARLQQQPNKDQLSAEICRKLATLPEYTAAGTVMLYVDLPSEVRTRPLLPVAWAEGKRVVVPYCADDRLELFLLYSLDELAEGTLHILEPKVELRSRVDRQVDVGQLDLVAVPGLAFDHRGGRLGRGKGYYDKLLRRVPRRTTLVALCFECQIFLEIPMLPYDVYVDKVITENAVYQRNRAR